MCVHDVLRLTYDVVRVHTMWTERTTLHVRCRSFTQVRAIARRLCQLCVSLLFSRMESNQTQHQHCDHWVLSVYGPPIDPFTADLNQLVGLMGFLHDHFDQHSIMNKHNHNPVIIEMGVVNDCC